MSKSRVDPCHRLAVPYVGPMRSVTGGHVLKDTVEKSPRNAIGWRRLPVCACRAPFDGRDGQEHVWHGVFHAAGGCSARRQDWASAL